MKNILNYYYSLYPDEISYKSDKYFFEYLNNYYVLEPYDRPISDIDCLYKINKQMLSRNILVHEIILNNENKILTYINNSPYILMEIYINVNKQINIEEVSFINNSSININCDKVLQRQNWVSLWETKNDYFEAQITEIEKKYLTLCSYANYYIGLAENAISYVRNISGLNEDVLLCICHKRINYDNTLFELYHPINYIFDYRVRDIAEYIKSSFFNNEDAYLLVEKYFSTNYLSYKEALLFYGRLLYPSYFFDMYDDIVNKNLSEDLIDNIVIKVDDYEMFLSNVHILLTKIYKRYIPGIDWIIKRSDI